MNCIYFGFFLFITFIHLEFLFSMFSYVFRNYIYLGVEFV